MKPIVILPNKKPIIMEVVGPKGKKVMEYYDTGDKPRQPYHILKERVQL